MGHYFMLISFLRLVQICVHWPAGLQTAVQYVMDMSRLGVLTTYLFNAANLLFFLTKSLVQT